MVPPDRPTPPQVFDDADGRLAPPFTRAELRAGLEGRRDIVRERKTGERDTRKRHEYRDIDDEAFTFVVTCLDDHGAPTGERYEARMPWNVFEANDRHPKDRATVSRERLARPGLGEHDCAVYRVDIDADATATHWYALDLPGPPVKIERRVRGELVADAVVESHERVAVPRPPERPA